MTAVPDPALGWVRLSEADGGADVSVGASYSLSQIQGLRFLPALDAHGAGLFRFVITDNGTTASQPDPKALAETLTITVTPVNDAPTVANPIADMTVAEDAAPTTIDLSGTFSDADIATDNDTLTLSTASSEPGLVSAAIDGGQLVLSFAADLSGAATITVTATDSQGASIDDVLTVTITEVNDAPTASDDTATVAEDGSVVIDPRLNDSRGPANEAGQILTVVEVTQGESGSVVVNTDGTVSYTPAPDFYGEDSFSYTVSDDGTTAGVADPRSSTATVTVTITPVADDPVAETDSATVVEDGSLTIDVLENDRDPDNLSPAAANAGLIVVGVTQGTHGSVTYSASGVSYAPDLNTNGTDVFTYTVDDGTGRISTATVTVEVTPVNDAPTATDVLAAAVEDGPAVTVAFEADDVDDDDDPASLSYTILTTPTEGVVANTDDGTFLFDPSGAFQDLAANESRSVTFTYKATDSHGVDSGVATVTITVTGINDTPTAVNDAATTDENSDTTLSVLSNDSDVDASDAFGVLSVDTIGTIGSVMVIDGATIRYLPDGRFEPLSVGETATDIFRYTVADGQGGTATATVTITIVGVNDDPSANDDTASAGEDDMTVAIAVLANDTDVDASDTLTVSSTDMGGTIGSVSIAPDGLGLVYRPEGRFEHLAAGETATDTFRYTVSDGQGGTATATVTVTVTGVNDTPEIATTAAVVSVGEGQTATNSGTFQDVDLADDVTITASIGSVVRSGTHDGSWSWTFDSTDGPDQSQSVTITADDGRGGVAMTTFDLMVENVAPTPSLTVIGSAWWEGSAIDLTGAATDPAGEADTLTYTWSVFKGSTLFDARSGVDLAQFRFTPDDDGNYTIDLTVADEDGGVNVVSQTITVGNVAPAATDDTITTGEDRSITFDPLGNDTDPAGLNDPLSIDSVTQGSHGSVTFLTDGTITYTPAVGFAGTDEFQYTISDGDGGSATGTVHVEVQNLVDISGRVFDDLDNDGLFEPANGEVGLGGVTVELFDQETGVPIAEQSTGLDGSYTFDANLGAGRYKIVAALPTTHLDGRETAGSLGGTVDNEGDSRAIADILVGDPGTSADAEDYLFAAIRPSQIMGLAWIDFNNDGEVNFGEQAIDLALIELTGIDDRGDAVSRTLQTDSDGIYGFYGLRPGTYTIHGFQPDGLLDGKDSLGLVNDAPAGTLANDEFSDVVLPQPDSHGENYNFGERPTVDGTVTEGQTAGIGFWQNKHGQSLIRSLNDGPDSTALANWLAATFPNMYGTAAGANDLTGRSNADVADFYKDLFKRNGKTALGGPPKLDAQALAVALAVYVTNGTLAGTTAAAYGFQVTETGVGTRTFNVGNNGAAFGVADGCDLAVLNLLLAVNDRTTLGVLYDIDGDGDLDESIESTFRKMANDVFDAINESEER